MTWALVVAIVLAVLGPIAGWLLGRRGTQRRQQIPDRSKAPTVDVTSPDHTTRAEELTDEPEPEEPDRSGTLRDRSLRVERARRRRAAHDEWIESRLGDLLPPEE